MDVTLAQLATLVNLGISEILKDNFITEKEVCTLYLLFAIFRTVSVSEIKIKAFEITNATIEVMNKYRLDYHIAPLKTNSRMIVKCLTEIFNDKKKIYKDPPKLFALLTKGQNSFIAATPPPSKDFLRLTIFTKNEYLIHLPDGARPPDSTFIYDPFIKALKKRLNVKDQSEKQVLKHLPGAKGEADSLLSLFWTFTVKSTQELEGFTNNKHEEEPDFSFTRQCFNIANGEFLNDEEDELRKLKNKLRKELVKKKEEQEDEELQEKAEEIRKKKKEKTAPPQEDQPPTETDTVGSQDGDETLLDDTDFLTVEIQFHDKLEVRPHEEYERLRIMSIYKMVSKFIDKLEPEEEDHLKVPVLKQIIDSVFEIEMNKAFSYHK